MSLKSDNGFVGYQILAPIRTSLYSKPETVVHLTEMNVFFSSLQLNSKRLARRLSALLSVTFVFIFGARNLRRTEPDVDTCRCLLDGVLSA